MKKATAVLAAMLFVAAPLLAQDNASARFGIKLAPNMSWTRSDTKGTTSDGSLLGYTFGLIMEFPVGATGNYEFATGVFLNNIGGKYKVDYTYKEGPTGPTLTRELESELKLRYIELPLTMKMLTNEIGYMRYYATLGLSTAFNIRAKADMDRPVPDQTGAYTTGFETLTDEDVKSDVSLFKAGLVVGAGLEYNFTGNTTALIGITYNNAFTNVLDNVEYSGRKQKLFADYLELTLGILF